MNKINSEAETVNRLLGRRSFLRGAFIGGSVLAAGAGTFLSGCGGGRASVNLPGNGGDGGSFDAVAAVNAVSAFAEALGSEVTPQEANERVLAYLKSRSEFTNPSVTPGGCVRAYFKDGTQFAFINNRFRDVSESGTAMAHTAITRAANDSLPKNLKAYCLSGLGTYLPDNAAQIGSWLASKGYTLPLGNGAPATLENLRNIRGAGALYLSTHGGDHGSKADGSDDYFVLTTTTRITPQTDNDPIIQQELKDGLLVRTVVKLEQRLGGWLEAEEVGAYAITFKFIERYMTFAENSFAYIDACSSEDFLIRTKCFDKGVSVYAGWSAPVKNGLANRNAAFVFDRLMGLNQEPNKEEINQRPFDYASILADLKRRGWHITPGLPGYADAELLFLRNGRNPDFSVLNPSIKFMDVNEQEGTLTLTGIFGHDTGTVTVGGTEVGVKSWSADTIVCTLPLTGPGSAGDVEVTVRQHKSNLRQLTEWKTVLKYDMDGPGTLEKNYEFNLRWRADIHSYRDNAGDEPVYRDVPFDFTTDSRGSMRGSGSHTDGNRVEYSWSGEQLLPYVIGDDPIPAGARGFIGSGTFKPKLGRMELFFGGSGAGGGTSKITPPNSEPQVLQFTSYFPVEALLPVPIPIPMETKGTLPAFNRPLTTFAEPFSQLTASGKVYFDRVEPRFSPLDEASRKR